MNSTAKNQTSQTSREQTARLKPKADEMSALLVTVYAALQSIGCTFEDLEFCHRATIKDIAAWEASRNAPGEAPTQ
jgi:hypothetical protein